MTAKLDGANGLIQQYDYQASTTGFSYTFAAGTNVLVMNPAGTLATGTVTMPAAPADGMTITFSSTQTITALTVNANTGQTLVGAPSSLGANSSASFVYRLANTTWYPISGSSVISNATLISPTISGTPTGVGVLTSGTAQASTSGTNIDFTSIPSWVKRITVMLDGVSTNGTSVPIVQIGTSGGVQTTGYTGATSQFQLSQFNAVYVGATSGFNIVDSTWASATNVLYGTITLTLVSSSSWLANGLTSNPAATIRMGIYMGQKSLGATLDRVRITTVNGTDTFDAGSINILYE